MGSVGNRITKKENNYSQFAPSEQDIIDRDSYYEDTDVPVNVSASDWKEEVDRVGIPDTVYDYMQDSSINERLRNNTLTKQDQNILNQLDQFTHSGEVKEGSILYSGVTSDEMLRNFDKKEGSTVTLNSYLSTSPDPVYAHGYGFNTNVMLKINVTHDTPIGKTYWEDSTGAEGVLSRRRKYRIGKSYTAKISGDKFRIIEVEI